MTAQNDFAAIIGLALLMVPVSVIAALILQASRARKIARTKRQMHAAIDDLRIAGYRAQEDAAHRVRDGAPSTVHRQPPWLPTADWRDAGPRTWREALALILRRWASRLTTRRDRATSRGRWT
jgi:hypothetical protein